MWEHQGESFIVALGAKTGEVIYAKENIQGNSTLFSSPTGVSDRIYIASKNIAVVVSAGPIPQILASNQLDEDFHASPVVVGNDLIMRGFEWLYCFSE